MPGLGCCVGTCPSSRGSSGAGAGRNAEDLVQRTLLACTQNLGRFEGRSTFRTYLFGIARNQYRMHRRAEPSRRPNPSRVATRPEESPSQLVAVRQEHVILVMALRRVPADFSVVLRKYYWEERSLEEIAVELGIPVGHREESARPRTCFDQGQLGDHQAPRRRSQRCAARALELVRPARPVTVRA